MLPIEFAARLAINVDACDANAAQGLSGHAMNYSYTPGIIARILGERLPLWATFADRLPFVLLGRRDFFDWFKVTFDQRAKTLTLEPYKERPELPPLKPKGP